MRVFAVTERVRRAAGRGSLRLILRRLGAGAILSTGLFLSIFASPAQAQTAATYCGLPLTASYTGYTGSGTGSATINQTDISNLCANANNPGTEDSDISFGLYPSASSNTSAFANNSQINTPIYSNVVVTSVNGVQFRVTATSSDGQQSSIYTYTLVGTNTSAQSTDFREREPICDPPHQIAGRDFDQFLIAKCSQ